MKWQIHHLLMNAFLKKFDFQHHREWVCRVENLGLTSNALHDCLLLIIMKMNENIFLPANCSKKRSFSMHGTHKEHAFWRKQRNLYAVCIHLEQQQQQAYPSSLMCVRAFTPVSSCCNKLHSKKVTIAKSLYKQKEWIEVRVTLIAQWNAF